MKTKRTTLTLALLGLMLFISYGTSSALQSPSNYDLGDANLYATPTKRKATPTPTRNIYSTGSYRITIPSSPKVAPSDVLDVVAFGGRGGDVVEPAGPYLLEKNGTITIGGFKANQKLRLVAYKRFEGSDRVMGSHYYVMDWIISVDKNGKASVEVTNYQYPKYAFGVFDPNTGKSLAGDAFAPSYLCPSTTKTRLQIGKNARVTITNGIPVRLRISPYLGVKILAEIPEGTTMKILDGPACNDKFVWWYVSVKGKKGWMAEGASGDWFLEPWK